MNKIDRLSLSDEREREKERRQTTKISNERGDIITDLTEIKRL